MTNNKTGFGTLLSWVLLFVILCSLGISTYQSYIGIKIQNDLYSKIWDTIQVPTTDEEGNEIQATNVIYNMNIYDYTDAVLVNIPVGYNDCWYDEEHHAWAHDKPYIKYLKHEDGSLTFDGVILNHGWNYWGTDKHVVTYLKPDDILAKDFLQKIYEYIFIGNIESYWGDDRYFAKDTVDFYNLNNVKYDYLVSYQQQTDEAHLSGGIFSKMYNLIVADAKISNITTKQYTKQFLHNTSELEYIKCFVDNECIRANIYCQYTRHLFTHSLPEITNEWFNSEILGGNA